jgi:cell wall-associated NlpC family hydrolase
LPRWSRRGRIIEQGGQARLTAGQGHLRGPTVALDPRIHAYRDDLADIALADTVIAPRYAAAIARACNVALTMVHAAPSSDSVAISALLHGETFDVFDLTGGWSDGWAWGACGHDGYVGYVAARALAAPGPEPTHRISAPDALVFAAANIKSPVIAGLPLNARVAAQDHDTRFVAAAGGFIHRRHVAALADGWPAPNAAALLDAARGFVGTPYRWGGRTRAGIDCSGLTQAALMSIGITAPRDSDQQETTGTGVTLDDARPGDLLFLPGHVGLVDHDAQLLHANAHWMSTVSEPIADVLARARASAPGTNVTVRRLLV